MVHHKQTINDLKLQNRIFKVILFFLFTYGVYHVLFPNNVISPCPADGCAVVYAKEPSTELKDIVNYILMKWERHGRKEQVRALACFISESGLRPDAYNFNKNGTWDFGVAQWNQVHGQKIDEIRDWKVQIDLAYKLYTQRGWKPWYGAGCH